MPGLDKHGLDWPQGRPLLGRTAWGVGIGALGTGALCPWSHHWGLNPFRGLYPKWSIMHRLSASEYCCQHQPRIASGERFMSTRKLSLRNVPRELRRSGRRCAKHRTAKPRKQTCNRPVRKYPNVPMSHLIPALAYEPYCIITLTVKS